MVMVSKAKLIEKLANNTEPTTLRQALQTQDAEKWNEACEAEHESLLRNKTYVPVSESEVPSDAKILRSRYVFKKATDSKGDFKKFKVRLVARGDLQDPRTYDETYAGTCQRKSIMLLLGIANRRKWRISTADISSAFLYGDLDTPIYMKMPDGSTVKLLKSLYGLKQAAHKFKEHLNNTLATMGFKRLCSDSSVYIGYHNGRKILITSHVDDLLFLSSDINDTLEIFNKLANTYSMTFQENATEYLGYTITRNEQEQTISLSQKGSVLKLLDLYPPKSFSKTSHTPFLRTTMIDEELLNDTEKRIFRQITGSLLYLSICTRPDLLPAVHELTRKMSSPRVIDLQKAKRAISYLASTADYCLVFKANDTEEIFGWADSSFNSGEGDRRNRYGYCFQLGRSSGMFVAVCKRSTLIAQSSTEAEFYCLAEATREMLWIRSFLHEILKEIQ